MLLPSVRSVAQMARALGSGPRGRWFESSRSDQVCLPDEDAGKTSDGLKIFEG